jgi:hypothetical protein
MSYIALTVPGMDGLPRRHDITIRVAKETGCHPDPAAFAVAASQAAADKNARIVSAHTAEEIICAVSVLAPGGPEALVLSLAIVADALKAPAAIRVPLAGWGTPEPVAGGMQPHSRVRRNSR